MSVEALLESEYAVLLSHPVVRSVEVVRYSVNRLDGYLRARCRLTNGDYLEIALHVNVSKQGVATDDYRYQWISTKRYCADVGTTPRIFPACQDFLTTATSATKM